jgi:hypothetical protein
MSKLAKVRKSFGRIKSAGSKFKGEGGIGKVGHTLLEFGTHAGLALASKNVEGFGQFKVRPDAAALVVSGIGMMFGKGKMRKLASATGKGAVHAMITRWASNDTFHVFSGPEQRAVSDEE